MKRAAAPACLRHLPPIDRSARDGRYRLVTDGDRFAAARWQGGHDETGAWIFPNGQPIAFTPDRYQP